MTTTFEARVVQLAPAEICHGCGYRNGPATAYHDCASYPLLTPEPSPLPPAELGQLRNEVQQLRIAITHLTELVENELLGTEDWENGEE